MIANEEGLRRLMRMSQSGDKQAYAVLLEQCGGWLARYFRQKIAPDAVDRWVDRLRQSYRHQTEVLDHHDAAEESHEEVVGARISIDRLLDLIPSPQAEVIRIVKIDGHSIADACIQTGQSEALVKVNIHRGLKKLAALIENE